MSTRKSAVIVRSVYGTAAVEWFLIFAIGTILVTRLYLRLTGYPQIGSGTLHIAHALWGGLLMTLALLTGWLLLGSTPRIVAIVMGGIGLGLFLDEVGKFVTKANDYFYGPSAEIMYVAIVAVLLASRVIRDFRPPSATEALANAAAIAADGVSHGLSERQRSQALAFLDVAAAGHAEPAATDAIRTLLTVSASTPDRLMRLRYRAVALIPGFLKSPRWVTLFGWSLAVGSLLTVVVGILALVVNNRADHTLYFELNHNPTASWILLISSAVTLTLALPAMIARRRTTRLWPMRALRLAALVYTLSNALVDFATSGFGALAGLAVGLFALAVISYHLDQQVQSSSAADRDQLRI